MAESLFILELEFLHIRGGCSLFIAFFPTDAGRYILLYSVC